jgi:hypothetical protein
MKRIAFILFLLSVAVAGYTQEKRTLSYCSNVGPVELILSGDSVRGRYRITVVKEPFEGVIKGVFKEGLLDGLWIDRDGRGHIIFAFNAELSEFTAFFNNLKRPDHWFVDPWRAVSTTHHASVSPEVKKRYSCNWK